MTDYLQKRFSKH